MVVPSSANGYTGNNGDGKEAILEIMVVVVVGVMDVGVKWFCWYSLDAVMILARDLDVA